MHSPWQTLTIRWALWLVTLQAIALATGACFFFRGLSLWLVLSGCVAQIGLLVSYLRCFGSSYTLLALYKNLLAANQQPADISENVSNSGNGLTHDIAHQYNNFLEHLREQFERQQQLNMLIAYTGADARKLATHAREDTQEQEQASELSFHANNQNANAIKQLSEHARGIADVNSRNLESARGSLTELSEMQTNIDAVHTIMQDFEDTVNDLVESSEQIRNILNTVKDFAAQTNMLALNAAIEAARAGEQGRGFAVVADEVRALAGKVGGAVSRIDEIVARMGEAVTKTTDGTHAVIDTAERAKTTIADSTHRFHSMVEDFEATHSDLLLVGTAVEEMSQNNDQTLERSKQIRDLGMRIHNDMQRAFEHSDILRQTTNRAIRDYVRTRIGRGVVEPVTDLLHKRKVVIQNILEEILGKGIDVFDRTYTRIPNTNPQQFTTCWNEELKSRLQQIMDDWFDNSEIDGISYCLPVDDQGYVPVNRSALSKAPTGDYEVDKNQSRFRYFALDKQRAEENREVTDIRLSTFTIVNGDTVFTVASQLMVAGKRWGTINIGLQPRVFAIDVKTGATRD